MLLDLILREQQVLGQASAARSAPRPRAPTMTSATSGQETCAIVEPRAGLHRGSATTRTASSSASRERHSERPRIPRAPAHATPARRSRSGSHPLHERGTCPRIPRPPGTFVGEIAFHGRHAVRCAREHLEERHPGTPRVAEGFDTVGPHVRREPERDVRPAAQGRALVGELARIPDGMRVGVLDDRRHAARCGRGGPGGEVLALGRSRVHEVHVRVDHPGHHEQATGIDDGRCLNVAARDEHISDVPFMDQQIGAPRPRARHDGASHDREIRPHVPPSTAEPRVRIRGPELSPKLYFMYECADGGPDGRWCGDR